jgi:D-amino peptidase
MKVYISADIEGVTGVTHWSETDLEKRDSAAFREQMSAEVQAACEGAVAAGASEILVKDAHDTGRNIAPSKLPKEVRLIRGWSGHPYGMMQELDKSFDAVVMIGYHSRAGAETNPLAHTMAGSVVYGIRLNDRNASEFLLNSHTAGLVGVPVAFVSGDKGLCEEVKAVNPNIGTVAVKEGIGSSTVSIHPEIAVARIREGATAALKSDLTKCLIRLPKHFSAEIIYKNHFDAYRYSFFPGAALKEPFVVHFETDDYFEVLRFLIFAI